MKKTVTLILFFLLILGCDDSDFDDALEITIPVNVIELKRGPIQEYVSATADIFAEKKATSLSQTDGYYRLAINAQTNQPFNPGDKVKKGQVIVFIDNPELENNIAIDSKELNLDISKREFEKQKSLYDKGGVTLRELKNAERTYIDAQYAYDNAIIQLSKLKISAPFDGLITSLPYYTRNVYVSTGQLMVEIMDYSNMYSEVSFPAKELERIKTGQQVIVTQYNLPDDSLTGTIEQVDPALDMQTRSFTARIRVENPEAKLRPGMFVKLETIVASRDSALVIPQEVILSKRRGKTVFVIEKKRSR